MHIVDLVSQEGRRYPAGRQSQHIVGGASPLQCRHFAMGLVTLDQHGGQVPWHSQDQEVVFFVLEGTGEMCVGSERTVLKPGQAVHVQPGVYHQLTNIGAGPLRVIACHGPSGDVPHGQQELDGTLPRAGVGAPPLPEGARAPRI